MYFWAQMFIVGQVRSIFHLKLQASVPGQMPRVPGESDAFRRFSDGPHVGALGIGIGCRL